MVVKKNLIRTDCPLVLAATSAGSLLDMQGRGHRQLHMAHRRCRSPKNIHVPINNYKRKDWDKLVNGESYGGFHGPFGLPGLPRRVFRPRHGRPVKIAKVVEGDTAEKAGTLKAGDVTRQHRRRDTENARGSVRFHGREEAQY